MKKYENLSPRDRVYSRGNNKSIDQSKKGQKKCTKVDKSDDIMLIDLDLKPPMEKHFSSTIKLQQNRVRDVMTTLENNKRIVDTSWDLKVKMQVIELINTP